jgi:hypothetical protein
VDLPGDILKKYDFEKVRLGKALFGEGFDRG